MSRSIDLFEELKVGGKEAILKWIQEKRVESRFLDYKQTQGQQNPGVFSSDDQNNLSKAISGFANTDGGIIVWGVKCKQDQDGVEVPTKPTPLTKVNKFKSKVERLLSGLSIPAQQGIENEIIEYNDDGDGFLVTHIPQSQYTPVRATKQDNYYMRSGSSFVVIPHGILATMFGKRPEPIIRALLTRLKANQVSPTIIELGRALKFRNEGTTILKDFFVNCKVFAGIGARTVVSFVPTDTNLWQRVSGDANNKCIVATDSLKIAPGVVVNPLELHITLQSPVTHALFIQIFYGCDGSKGASLELKKEIDFLKLAPRRFFDPLSNYNQEKERFQMHLEDTQNALKEFDEKLFDFKPIIEYID